MVDREENRAEDLISGSTSVTLRAEQMRPDRRADFYETRIFLRNGDRNFSKGGEELSRRNRAGKHIALYSNHTSFTDLRMEKKCRNFYT